MLLTYRCTEQQYSFEIVFFRVVFQGSAWTGGRGGGWGISVLSITVLGQQITYKFLEFTFLSGILRLGKIIAIQRVKSANCWLGLQVFFLLQ